MIAKWKVQAFSITEVLVSLVVSAIVVGITFVLFEIISGRMHDFKDQNQYISDLNRLTYTINKDIFEAVSFNWDQQDLVFTSYSGDKTYYNKGQDYLVRNGTFIDTFNLEIGNMKIDTLASSNSKIIYQRLKINISAGGEPQDFSFFKRVYSNVLMEKEIVNER